MLKLHGGERVRGGIYWNLSTGEFIRIPEEGGILPGSGHSTYMRVALPAAIAVGPLLGMAFVVFLPLTGILAVAFFAGYQFWKAMRWAGRGVFQASVPLWSPSVSYIARLGRGAREAPRPVARSQDTHKPKGRSVLEELERELEERQREERGQQ